AVERHRRRARRHHAPEEREAARQRERRTRLGVREDDGGRGEREREDRVRDGDAVAPAPEPRGDHAGVVSHSYFTWRRAGRKPASRMRASIFVASMPKVVPALETTFSSNITLPKSSAPKRRATCPTPGPCVTHDAPT